MIRLCFLSATVGVLCVAGLDPETNKATDEKPAAEAPAFETQDEVCGPLGYGKRILSHFEDLLKSVETEVFRPGRRSFWPWTTPKEPASANLLPSWREFDRTGQIIHQGIRLDALESDKEFVVNAELPGFEPSEVRVSVQGGRLKIHAKHDVSKEEEGQHWRWRERSSEAKTRTLLLPPNANFKEVKAKFKHGLLNITIPKLAQGLPGLGQPLDVAIES
jgi:HSP20 family protein